MAIFLTLILLISIVWFFLAMVKPIKFVPFFTNDTTHKRIKIIGMEFVVFIVLCIGLINVSPNQNKQTASKNIDFQNKSVNVDKTSNKDNKNNSEGSDKFKKYNGKYIIWLRSRNLESYRCRVDTQFLPISKTDANKYATGNPPQYWGNFGDISDCFFDKSNWTYSEGALKDSNGEHKVGIITITGRLNLLHVLDGFNSEGRGCGQFLGHFRR